MNIIEIDYCIFRNLWYNSFRTNKILYIQAAFLGCGYKGMFE